MQVPINSLKRKMFQILYLTLVYKIMRLRAPAHTAVRWRSLETHWQQTETVTKTIN